MITDSIIFLGILFSMGLIICAYKIKQISKKRISTNIDHSIEFQPNYDSNLQNDYSDDYSTIGKITKKVNTLIGNKKTNIIKITEAFKNQLFAVENLVEDTNIKRFSFDYEQESRLSPSFIKKTFVAYNEDVIDILGTVTLSKPAESNQYPSEVFFGFKVPKKYKNQNITEIGRLVCNNQLRLEVFNKHIIYLSLLLMVIEYGKRNQIDRWIATVNKELLNEIKKLGIPVEIIDTKVRTNGEIISAMGSYPYDVFFITASMEDSFRALEKFQALIDDGTIEIILLDFN